MRAVVQRVSEAKVTVADQVVGAIGPGLLVLLGVEPEDSREDADFLRRKVTKLRIFEDDKGKMNRSVLDCGGSLLLVSQFTLCADLSRGNRPSFIGAAAPALAEEFYVYLGETLASEGLQVETGRFGATMAVSLVNDGPVTIWIDSKKS